MDINNNKQLVEKFVNVAASLRSLLSNASPSQQQTKDIITLFVQIDEIKKKIVENLFGYKKKTGARDRILAYLKENVGQKVSGDEIRQVAGISEYARRVRELRHEHGGWQISTGMNRANLRPNEYVLENLEQKPVFERMNAKIWDEVLKRDNFTCQNCLWSKDDPQTNNRRFLEVHHKDPVRAHGKPEVTNLITLCNVCHDAQE